MTPDNGAFATAAYLLAALVYAGYVASLKLRERRLRQRLARLDAPSRPPSHRPAGA
ncbi:MAG TPA: hypothetical protein VKA54_02600 [Gemmatimonadaceae bacterium]|nr:hypothetical protein [Gemmatimonadaceae bacterium]